MARKPSSDDEQRLVWHRVGDHKADANRILAQCSKENRGKLPGDPTIEVTKGGGLTLIQVNDVQWWSDYMRVHDAWQGPVRKVDIMDVLNPPKPLG